MEVTFTVVTPAYAGTANTSETEGLRPPTLKALLRFWWRTMKPDLSAKDLFREEAEIFGSTGKGQGLRVVPVGPWKELTHDCVGTLERDPLHVYMAYGPVAWDRDSTADPRRKKGASVLKTPRIHAGQSVGFKLYLRKPEHRCEVANALWLLSAFGGFGSRSRRGWGSLRVRAELGAPLSALDPHENVSRLNKTLAEGLAETVGRRANIQLQEDIENPLHTAFSPSSRLFVGTPATTCEQALGQGKDAYYDYHRLLGAERGHAEGDVGPDHNKRSAWLENPPGKTDTTPFGSAFGLPHNAQFSSSGPDKGAEVNVGMGPDLGGRRASPVFFKVIGDGNKFVPLILWLPAMFLPDGMAPHVSVRRGKSMQVQYCGDRGIEAFFDGNASMTRPWEGLSSKGWQEVIW